MQNAASLLRFELKIAWSCSAVTLSIFFFQAGLHLRITKANTSLLGREARHRRILSLLLWSRFSSRSLCFQIMFEDLADQPENSFSRAASLSKLRIPWRSIRSFRGQVRTGLSRCETAAQSVVSNCLMCPSELMSFAF
jgi:hypothetical protein